MLTNKLAARDLDTYSIIGKPLLHGDAQILLLSLYADVGVYKHTPPGGGMSAAAAAAMKAGTNLSRS